MNELDAYNAGFVCIKQYEHDEYYTNRYQNGVIQIEFTYKGKLNNGDGEIQTVDITIEEIIGKEVSLEELIILNKILNKAK